MEAMVTRFFEARSKATITAWMRILQSNRPKKAPVVSVPAEPLIFRDSERGNYLIIFDSHKPFFVQEAMELKPDGGIAAPRMFTHQWLRFCSHGEQLQELPKDQVPAAIRAAAGIESNAVGGEP